MTVLVIGEGSGQRGNCRSCRDPIEPFMLDGKLVRHKEYCKECFLEKARGKLPKVTDSSLTPPGTGTVWRQQVKRPLTDS